ncbi:uncharacterized protein Dvar_80660 [Desulfosarcina variabilis str. Montpellier]|uniref:hypothetical protein n=1 Tax=Desulfosarcina variabilis TaxID=2300 RepID=UPI003AFA2B35
MSTIKEIHKKLKNLGLSVTDRPTETVGQYTFTNYDEGYRKIVTKVEIQSGLGALSKKEYWENLGKSTLAYKYGRCFGLAAVAKEQLKGIAKSKGLAMYQAAVICRDHHIMVLSESVRPVKPKKVSLIMAKTQEKFGY